MKRIEISPQMRSLLIAARRVAVENDAEALILLADLPFSFSSINKYLRSFRLVVASDKEEVQQAAEEDDIAFVRLH